MAEEFQPYFINDFQRQHYKACMRANEYLKRHPMSAERARANADRLHELAMENNSRRRPEELGVNKKS